MNRCKNCKWWSREANSLFYIPLRKGVCRVVTDHNGDGNELAHVNCETSAICCLFTHEEFGCIHFEKKPDGDK